MDQRILGTRGFLGTREFCGSEDFWGSEDFSGPKDFWAQEDFYGTEDSGDKRRISGGQNYFWVPEGFEAKGFC